MARSFGVWVVYCNRVGVEDGVSFWGGGEIVSPAGERLAKAGYYDEDYVAAVLSDDAVRRRRIVNPLVRDEDLDLTINELSRIRGRAVEKAVQEGEGAPRRPERGGFDSPREAREPRPGRFDRGDEERRPPRAPFEGKRDFDKPRTSGPGGKPRDRDDAPRARFGARDDGPRGGFGARDRDDAPRGKFGPRDRGDAPRGNFGPRDRGDAPRGNFGARDRDDAPRGRFGPRDRDDAPRGRFGGQGRDRDDSPRPRTGGFGPPRGGGFGPPRGGGFGPPRTPGGFAPPRRSPGAGFKDDRGGEARSFKPRFGDGAPRHRQRPEPSRKPFHKGGKPRGRGRKDD